MYYPSPTKLPSAEDLLDPVRQALDVAAGYSTKEAHEDGHWCGELKANATLTAEYISLLCALGLEVPDPSAWIKWFLAQQKRDGGWGIAGSLPGEISTSVEAYFALKLLGLPPDHQTMQRARYFILASGGIAKVRIFTRINLALFGLFPWSAVPELPPELILLPSWAPFSIYNMSSWARSTIVPLSIVRHHRPIYTPSAMEEAGAHYLDELWCDVANKNVPYVPSMWSLLRSDLVTKASVVVDWGLHKLNGLRTSSVNRIARRRCLAWILDRQEDAGDWAGIFPPMFFGILALLLEGYSIDSGPVQGGFAALRRFTWTDEAGKRMQSCVSPVWDTALMTIGMLDSGVAPVQLAKPIQWIRERQHSGPKGDWRVLNPMTKAGGWAFEYHNTWYPDVDDTAAVILAFAKQDPSSVNSTTITNAIEWILGMQNSDGGWGAFDSENDKEFFNKIPFSDMNSMCDPSTADVTGRILEAFGVVMGLSRSNEKYRVPGALVDAMKSASSHAITYLEQEEESFGGWYGRWGVNYIYGTSNVLCGLAYFERDDRGEPNDTVQTLIEDGVRWLCQMQNPDGGWGECLETYRDTTLAGQGPSTATQTAWAVMGLMIRLPPGDPAVRRGINFLVQKQAKHGKLVGSWDEEPYTGVGFPNHFYIDYFYYKHCFPMMALGRYASLAGRKIDS
ncbi:terpenoid cyclases/protein prenyltransferase alpha-alpha toroid [Aspergillus pseudodeflectus]|uniref:Terpene cyclase/mutase family member n=1 Tax=Aspergillus pseudodeflectus TaxID=176178 RepID=A0ABR4JQI0_9EURO